MHEGDDKVEAAARKTGSSVCELTEHYTQDFLALGTFAHRTGNALPQGHRSHIKEMTAFALELHEAGVELQDRRDTGETEWEWTPQISRG